LNIKDMADYLWKALLTEFLGTFTLVFVGAGAVALTTAQGGSLIGSAFAFGLALMAIIYAWGSFSGTHVNPAVSFGYAVAGRMGWGLMALYWIAQFLGGIVAAALIFYFFGSATGAGASIGSFTNTDAWKAVFLEAILTMFLVLTVLLVTRNPTLALVSGLAIGLVLTFDMLIGFPFTGASMNPARSFGPAIFSNNLGTFWIYLVGPLLGALVGALVYRLMAYDFSCHNKVDCDGNVVTDDCGNKIKVCDRPVLDKCGKNMMEESDCGKSKPVMKQQEIVDIPLGHFQETLGTEMAREVGVDAKYAKQELGRVMEQFTRQFKMGGADAVRASQRMDMVEAEAKEPLIPRSARRASARSLKALEDAM
jgi:MIP family channel proteins